MLVLKYHIHDKGIIIDIIIDTNQLNYVANVRKKSWLYLKLSMSNIHERPARVFDFHRVNWSLDSSVSVVTRYRLGGPGIKSR